MKFSSAVMSLTCRIGLAQTAALGLLVGCAGVVGTPSDEQTSSGELPSATVPGTIDGPDGLNGNVTCKAGAAPESLMRRLTRFEYNNTVRDLLKLDVQPVMDFPSEEMRDGFVNNAQALIVTPILTERYLTAAEKLADAAVTQKLSALLPCDASRADADCARAFVETFGQRAFRRPLTQSEVDVFASVYAAGAAGASPKAGVAWVIQTMLQSPAFLYRIENGNAPANGASKVALTPWETASRLSYLLWGTMPDEALFEAARAGKLTTVSDVKAQARRMLADVKARAVIAHFHEQWFGLTELAALEKDPKVFPAFNREIATAMTQQLQMFVDWAFFDANAGSFDHLMKAPVTFINTPLAKYYGLPDPNTGAKFALTKTDPEKYAGLLGQGGLLAGIGKSDQTSPPVRGKFVMESLLCSPLPAPPAGLMVKPPATNPGMTTRERFAIHDADAACKGCHALMDPIGLGLENFDGAGRWRDSENGKPVDASGAIDEVVLDISGPFNGAAELAEKLASSEQARDCAVTQWFRFAYGRTEGAGDDCTLAALKQRFHDSDFSLQGLVLALTETEVFLTRNAGAQR
ncbi:MAG: DUF1592 domain-containing protein [Deltaproteobacteria bacterium]|nr:DUF1592 domain-containing protein [Deltaproteobacteria bacterium]